MGGHALKAVELALLTATLVAATALAASTLAPHPSPSAARAIARIIEAGDGAYLVYTPYPVAFEGNRVVVYGPAGPSVAEANATLAGRGQGLVLVVVEGRSARVQPVYKRP